MSNTKVFIIKNLVPFLSITVENECVHVVELWMLELYTQKTAGISTKNEISSHDLSSHFCVKG